MMAARTITVGLPPGVVTEGDLAEVATTGDYDDLSNLPTIPDSADDIGAAPATRTVGTGLGTSGTVNLDMVAVHGTIQRWTPSGTPSLWKKEPPMVHY